MNMKKNEMGFPAVRLVLLGGVLLAGTWATAKDFPAAVDGVVTLDIASGSETYDVALGNVTKLVKTGAGEAVLTVATTDFKGTVVVNEGTLRITDLKAVGEKTPITVDGDAATFCLNAEDSTTGNGCQSSKLFWDHSLTVRGNGANGNGAFYYKPVQWKMYDQGLDTLTLTDGATIKLGGRIGIKKAINLNGHKLTRTAEGGGDTWMMSSVEAVGKGEIVNQLGVITMQGAIPKVEDPSQISLTMEDQKMTFWAFGRCDIPLTMNGKYLQADNGLNGGFSSPVTFNKYTEITTQGNTALSLTGKITVNAQGSTETTIRKYGAGKLYLDGPMEMNPASASVWNMHLENSGPGWIVCTANVNRVIGAYVSNNMGNGCSKLWLGGGTLFAKGMTRVSNGAAHSSVWQTGGVYMNNAGDQARIGESGGGYGAWVMDGGEARFSNGVFVAENPNSKGMVRQRGGLFEVARTSDLMLGNKGRGELYVLGGTNDSSTAANLRMSQYLGSSALVVSGKGSLVKAPAVTLGCTTTDVTRCCVCLKDGGTLSARRFYSIGKGATYAFADNGVLMPTVWGGFANQDLGAEGFYDRALTKFVILSGGLTVDTSDCYSEDRTKLGNSWSPLQYSAPSGKRIATIALPTSGEFTTKTYYAPAMIKIEGKGWGATAYVEFDYTTETLKEVVITCGGCDYDEDTEVSVCSPDGKTWYDCTYTLADNAPGGTLTKRGQQELILCGTQTYTGGTIIEQGNLKLNDDTAFPANTAVTVKPNGVFNVNGKTIAVSALSGEGTVNYGENMTVKEVHVKLDELFADGHKPLAVNSRLNLADGAKVVVDDPENYGKYGDRKAGRILTANSLNGSVTFDAPDGWGLRVTNNSLSLGPRHGLTVLVK